MADWRIHLTETEVARLEAIKAEKRALQAEQRRIYDRCRKRSMLGGKEV